MDGKKSKKAPFDKNLSSSTISKIYDNTMKRTERYRVLKQNNLNDDEIKNIFNKPINMKLFSWLGNRYYYFTNGFYKIL